MADKEKAKGTSLVVLKKADVKAAEKVVVAKATEKTVEKAELKEARRKAPQKQGWKLAIKILLMLVWVGAAVIVAQLIVGYPMLWILGSDQFSEPVWTAIYSALSYILALIMIVFIPRKTAGWKELGFKGWPTWTDIGLAPVGFVVHLLLAAALTALFSCFPWFDASQAQEVGFDILASGGDRIIAFITLVVVAPIAEETIFRGWLYGKLRKNLSGRTSEKVGMTISILLTSLLFGIVHLQWNVGVNVFAMSVVLCALREITGTTYAGMILHMLKNGVAFYLLYVAGM